MTVHAGGAEGRVFLSVQILRAIAAGMVVVYHVQVDLVSAAGATPGLPNLTVGAAGVDIFFVISGFIMVYASERQFGAPGGWRSFLLRRIIRICPLYWAVTAFHVLVAMAAPGLFSTTFGPAFILASCLFWPVARPDGLIAPVVAQGWTLNFEMFFYLLLAAAMVAPRRRAVLVTSVALVTFVLAGQVGGLPFPLSYWAHPIILDFVAGLLLGLAHREGLRLGPGARIGLVLAGVLAYLLAAPAPGDDILDSGARSFLVWGAPAVLIVAGAVLGEPAARLGGAGRVLCFLGDASYALYLTHHIPIRAARRLAVWAGLEPLALGWLYAGAILGVATLLAFVVLVAFERPVAAFLKARHPFAAGRPHSA